MENSRNRLEYVMKDEIPRKEIEWKRWNECSIQKYIRKIENKRKIMLLEQREKAKERNKIKNEN